MNVYFYQIRLPVIVNRGFTTASRKRISVGIVLSDYMFKPFSTPALVNGLASLIFYACSQQSAYSTHHRTRARFIISPQAVGKIFMQTDISDTK